MALMGSLTAGSSGVIAHSRAMTVVGSNIANVNTVGFKASRVAFEDMLSSDFKTGLSNTKISQGVNLASVSSDFTQGAFKQTELQTDMAVNGNGFFVLKDDFGSSFFTRAGQFTYDDEGYLTSERGLFVQSKEVDPVTKESVGVPGKLKILGIVDPPKPTGDGSNGSGIKVVANVDSNSPIRELPFDPTNVKKNMYNFATSVTINDNLGEEHTASIIFRKRPDIPPQTDATTGATIPGVSNQWEWYVMFDGADIGQKPGQDIAVGGGFLQFDNEGRMLQVTGGRFVAQGGGVDPVTGQALPSGPPILQPVPVNPETGLPQIVVDFGADAPQLMGLNFGQGSNPDDPNDERTGLDGLTQFAGASRTVQISADGHPAGNIEGISVATDGTVEGKFDTGYSRPLGRIILGKFDNPGKLTKAGENLFTKHALAGKEVINDPGIGGLGTVRAQVLEQSNVDLANEFVSMVEEQRSFQASAKTVTTSDEMIQDTIQMKR